MKSEFIGSNLKQSVREFLYANPTQTCGYDNNNCQVFLENGMIILYIFRKI